MSKVADVFSLPPLHAKLSNVRQNFGYTNEEVIGFLSDTRDNSVKKAYQLIVETDDIHRSIERASERGLTKNESYLSASPPPWNQSDLQQRNRARQEQHPRPISRMVNLQMTSHPQSATPDSPAVDSPAAGQDTATGKPKSNKRSKISLLTSSYPLVHARMYSQQAPQHLTQPGSRTVRGINLEGEMKVFVPPVIKRKPQRYHFGIRSRGQGALEVMQEIYKSLERMNAEWIEKPPNPESEDKNAPPLDPFTIKCRWRKQYPRKVWKDGKMVKEGVDDMYVYMEIQLYQQPEPKDYLVDFKWGGYELVGQTEGKDKTMGPIVGGEESVHSCFPFLDLASTLINALARGGD